MFVGPSLVSADLANNALPLYLSRPFTRSEYVAGKMSVLVALLSAVTWIPGLLVFLLQAYLEGWSWTVENLWIAWALVAGSIVWIIALSLAALAISALVRWALIARGAMFGVLIVPSAFAGIVNAAFSTTWGNLVSPAALLSSVLAQLFHTTRGGEVPPVAAWIMICAICGTCLLILARKVRAYEVIR
jgi:ABC-2 type transport system permease protein